MSEILRVVRSLLGEKVMFFNSLKTIDISGISKLFVNIHVAFLNTFQNNLSCASTLNIGKVMKYYNPSDQCFETDFTFRCKDLFFIFLSHSKYLLILISANSNCKLNLLKNMIFTFSLVSTSQKSPELLSTLNLGSYCRRKKTL